MGKGYWVGGGGGPEEAGLDPITMYNCRVPESLPI